jgi:Holliday junction resolvase
MREKTFEMQVRKWLESKGCWVLKTISNGMQRAGIPDLLICCNGMFIGVELKTEKGKSSPLQEHELSEISKAGGRAFLLRPQGFETFKEIINGILIQQS